MSTPQAYIVDAVRTPVGKKNGTLAPMHSADLGAEIITGLLDRTGIDPEVVDDVVFGCLDTIGSQSGNIGRTAWLAAGGPLGVPGTTIDRQCGSSQQAVHFAAQGVMSGTQDVVIAGGVQNMSAIPISAAMIVGQQYGFHGPTAESVKWVERFGDAQISQFVGADMMAQKWDISREDMERWALQSHQRARAAIDEGRFKNEIVPVGDFAVDETVRDTTLEKMAALAPLSEGSRLTAAVASQISDGASATLVVSEKALKEYGLTPRARIHYLTVRGDDPIMMLSAPIPATAHALAKTGLSIDDIDVVEINEAFAPVVLAWIKETGADPAKVNPNGGAIALGHPLGATGTKLFATLLNELERTGGRYGLQTMCEGGGTANVTIIERLS
ncbi:MAG TPA: acetyl-CoA C-acetyltransferase [Gordonia sp. (in: high G+C Gram-positive bacteria)]|uniref:acetyl-CoA C-acetyltransferase n=1 Tax=unclassified Gordonia (in: high G+C Gram-positive bacteria) TaxID=2657482 RepID=UPI000FAAB6C5|nr:MULTISPECIES: acetyl-CoA C-acetyltransferase [unclassified Gordonia (in: high G+C Gram-positive bacteria)]RUP41243.1 MAG: acetyl-CoA C-acetyltransferase [Gordonia sp. (in: high G+C Gram-positive bacteria)]HNP55556.1 acetyl-CoA C-acetyltransferase [Gordonia sp. (in: high G+C Gram-positive bacteria)]HRC51026.1 acetyl-CoA C-acetyltransferase [Gordonia sp. (in: high G+C Gram-positive bacteria)]